MRESSPRGGWVVVLGGLVILICLGVAYAWGVFLLPIDREMGWGRAKISFAVSVLLLVFSVFMAVGGLLERRIGPRATASLGGGLVGLGWILASFAQGPLALYLTYGLLGGMGTGLGYMPALSCGIRWFPHRQGLVTGIIVFGFGFGTAFLSPLLTSLLSLYGWRVVLQLAGGALGLVILLAAQLLRHPPRDRRFEGEGTGGSLSCAPGEMVRTATFRNLFFSYLIAMFAGLMTVGHLVAYLADRGFSSMQGAIALTVLSVLNGAGRILFGYAADRWGGKRVLLLLFLMISVGMTLLFHAATFPGIVLLAGLIGFVFGGFLAVYPVLTLACFGRRDFSVNYGLIFIGYGLGCFLGPLVGGWVHDLTQSYAWAFHGSAALTLLAGWVLYRYLPSPPSLADPPLQGDGLKPGTGLAD